MAGKGRNGARGAEPRSRFLVALLLLLVGVAGVLTFQGEEAARSHRATAERVLRNYATVAVWGLKNNAQEAIYTLVLARLDSVKVAKRLAGVPIQQTLGPRTSGRCDCLGRADLSAHFVLTREGDLRT